MPRVFLGLGSNKGDSRAIIAGAFQALCERLTDARLSSLYSTSPLYVVDQPPFLNAAAVGDFSGDPRELLAFVNSIETRFGRDRSRERRRGERSLDIDILLFGDLIVSEPPTLVIPHEGLLERKFALLPLLELDPSVRDPRSGRPLWEAFERLGAQGIYYADASPL